MNYILSGNPNDVEKVIRENRIRVARGLIKFEPVPAEPAEDTKEPVTDTKDIENPVDDTKVPLADDAKEPAEDTKEPAKKTTRKK